MLKKIISVCFVLVFVLSCSSKVKPDPEIPAAEAEIFRLVNIERGKVGSPFLKYSIEMADVAETHSKDMSDNNYFSHTNPAGELPQDRKNRMYPNIRGSVGENIASRSYSGETDIQAAQALMTQWINSPGHYANITNARYKEIGVGVVKNASGKYYGTQVFLLY